MSKQICLTAILLCFYSLGNAQWKQVPGYSANGNASSMIVISDTIIVSSVGNAYDGIPGLFTSTDYGITWSVKNTSLGTSACPLITNGGYIYAGTPGQGVFLSTDKGNNWIPENNGLPLNFPVIDLIAKNTDFYVCGTGGLFHSTDNTNTWENISLSGTSQALSAIVAGDTIITCFNLQSAGTGVYKSMDNGANWTLINAGTGLSDTRIRKFALYYNTVFAASDGDLGTGNIYVSNDNGISWTAANGLNDQGHNYPYNFIAFNKTIFLATSNGVYRSIDDGLNWTNTGCTNAISLAIIRDTLFAGTGFHGIWRRGLSELTGSIEDIKDNRSFTAYPNPASSKITIEMKRNSIGENTFISLYTIQGKLILQQPLQKDMVKLDISGLEKGVYLLQLTNNKITDIIKVLKN